MYDIHCHLLPGIDDGPANIEAALNLARQAIENGVTHVVATPHIHAGRWENTTQSITQSKIAFEAALQANQIPLKLGMGAEVRIDHDIFSMVEEGKLPFLGWWQGKRVLLLEMHHGHILAGADKLFKWLMDQDILPMLAHPERNKDVMRRLDNILPFVEMGCLIQLTAGSVVGQFGRKAQLRAKELLKMGAVTVIASDAHHVGRRPVNLHEGLAAASKIIGEQAARKLVFENPKLIVEQQFSEASVEYAREGFPCFSPVVNLPL